MIKLIRDNIPELIKKDGKMPIIDTIKEEGIFIQFLQQKLIEEVNEFIEALRFANDSLAQEEIADILEVLEAIAYAKSYQLAFIEQLKKKKKQDRGGFEKRIILVSND